MEEKQNTKDKILNIAENCFAQYGFDGSSIRDIVIEAKVNNAAIFYHFKTKQKLFESVFDRLFLALACKNYAKKVSKSAPKKP